MEIQKKVALVTGASRGIGRACVEELNRVGYSIALHYRSNPDLAEEIAAQLSDAKTFQADLTSQTDCEALIKQVKEHFGRIDVLVNNAGESIDQVITFAKPEDFDRLISINLKPTFFLTKLVSRHMIRQKGGSIINITSVVGHMGNAGQSMYAATKGAVTALTQSSAKDLAGFNIRCNAVAPGFIKTEMTDKLDTKVQELILEKVPMRRLGNADEVAQAVAFLASEKASYITGSTIHVNGGMY